MGRRLRGLTLLAVLLGVGIFLGSALSQWWRPLPGRESSASPLGFPGRVRVEVLNGGGAAGMAREATALLRDLGLDVVYYGNAENFSEDPSVVLDRIGQVEGARKVADALGIHDVRSEPDPNLFVDLTIRLGPEWTDPSEAGEAGETSRPWWDFRRFLKRDETDEDPNQIGFLRYGEEKTS